MPTQTSCAADSDLGLQDAARADRIFKALSSGPRRQILGLLAAGARTDDDRCYAADEVCACVFSDRLGLGAPTVSHHMKVLTEAGLITSEKRGLWVYYRLRPEVFCELAEALRSLCAVANTAQRMESR